MVEQDGDERADDGPPPLGSSEDESPQKAPPSTAPKREWNRAVQASKEEDMEEG